MLLSFSTREICIHQVAYRLPLRCILHVACADLHLTDSERRARRVPKFSSATLLSMYNVSFYHKNDFSFIDGTKRVHTYTSTWSRSQMLPDHACAHTWTYKRRYIRWSSLYNPDMLKRISPKIIEKFYVSRAFFLSSSRSSHIPVARRLGKRLDVACEVPMQGCVIFLGCLQNTLAAKPQTPLIRFKKQSPFLWYLDDFCTCPKIFLTQEQSHYSKIEKNMSTQPLKQLLEPKLTVDISAQLR